MDLEMVLGGRGRFIWGRGFRLATTDLQPSTIYHEFHNHQPNHLPHHRPPNSKPATLTTKKPAIMSTRDLQALLPKLRQCRDYATASPLLSQAKLALLKLSSLTPTPTTPASTLLLAREVFEIGAILSIKAKQADVFTRYVSQLQPFYELPASTLPREKTQQAKVTGLFLLLLLTKGDYAGFHTELEGLEMRVGSGSGSRGAGDVEGDKYLGYPIRLERWLMEGSYDRVWKAMASGEVPSEEYGVFTEVRIPSFYTHQFYLNMSTRKVKILVPRANILNSRS